MPTKLNIAKAAIALSDQGEFVELKRMVQHSQLTRPKSKAIYRILEVEEIR